MHHLHDRALVRMIVDQHRAEQRVPFSCDFAFMSMGDRR